MTTPNTPANGGQIPDWKARTKQKYGAALMAGMNEESIETLGISFMKAEIADLRASLAAPAELPVAWMKTHTKECTSASHKKWMENAGFGVWGEVAEQYAIPLYSHPAAPAIPTVDRNSVLDAAIEVLDTELGLMACTGSMAPAEDALGKLADAVLKSAAPTSVPQLRKATSELTLKELAAEFAAVAELGCDYTISAGVCKKLFDAMTTPPADVAQPAAQVAVPGCTCPSGDGSLRWPCPAHPQGKDDHHG